MRTIPIILAIAACLFLIGSCVNASGKKSLQAPSPAFSLTFPGSEFLVDYGKYGYFKGEGTIGYQYIVTNFPKLSKAAGTGVYPNTHWIKKDSTYQRLKKEKKIGNHWEKKDDPVAGFYSWVDAPEEWGVRQFFTAKSLKDNGHLIQAVKAFYAVLVHFPRSACYSEDQSYVWYVAPAALNQLDILLAQHPELNISHGGGMFEIKNGDDTDLRNDTISIAPGRLVSKLVGRENASGYPKEEWQAEKRDSTLLNLSLTLASTGSDIFVDYAKYGEFRHLGKDSFQYVLQDAAGLAEAMGEGIWPNTADILKNPLYQKYRESGWLETSHWDNIRNFKYPALMYVSWATAKEDPGRKLFYTAEALKYAGIRQNDPTLLKQALKAYHALLVHFPGTVMYAPEKAYLWYASQAAISKIIYILRTYPQLGTEYRNGFVKVANEYDITPENDVVACNPGSFVKVPQKRNPSSLAGLEVNKQLYLVGLEVVNKQLSLAGLDVNKQSSLAGLEVVKQRGKGKVHFRKFSNGHWQMIVEGKPFMVRSVLYEPTTIGDSPHDGTYRNFMFVDDNHNGKPDGPYDAWVDKNRNGRRDADEPVTGDFQLLREMGANAIRYYHKPVDNLNYDSEKEFDKSVLRDMYRKYGMRMIMGDYLGAYTVGSGADWKIGTDYRDKKQRARMKKLLHDFVMDHKDEDYVLMWLLGNENNMFNQYGGVNATKTLAGAYPRAYCDFLNEVAAMIHEIDPNHPVGVANLETQMIEYFEDYAPELDYLGINSYRGWEGFGNLFQYCARYFDRPVVISEYGSDVLHIDRDTIIIDEQSQLTYHKNAWEDIVYNAAGNPGQGNAIGGMLFEWLDEWWKSNQGPKEMHQWTKDSPMAFQDGWSSEEWLGLMGQGHGEHSPFLREPRMAYYYYKKVWNKP